VAAWRARQREAAGLPVRYPGTGVLGSGRPCAACGAPLGGARADARYCGDRCRQAAHRAS